MTDVTPPPAPQSPAVPAAASTEIAPVERKSSGVGIASLLIAILAVLGDIAIFIFAFISVAALIANFDVTTFDFGGLLAGLGAAALIGVIAFFGGIVLALLALLLGIIAIAKNRGRVAGVFGVIFSVLVLLTHGSIAAAIAGSGDALSGVLPS